MKAKTPAVLLTAAVMWVPIVAAADPFTYDFTGAVTAANGIYGSIADGSTVTGSPVRFVRKPATATLRSSRSNTCLAVTIWLSENSICYYKMCSAH